MSDGSSKRSYASILRGLGGSALITAVAGLLIWLLSRALLPRSVRDEVIIQGIPFVAFVASATLLFIMVIALTDHWLHRRIPHRTHRAVEFTLIGGVLLGMVCLFQPLSIAPYGFGFGLLLLATLALILWNHVLPRSARDDPSLPPFTRRSRVVGALLGLLVWVLVFGAFALSGRPEAPYGMLQRRWDFLSAERQAEAADAARREYFTLHLPALALYGLVPGLVVFYLTREALTAKAPLGDAWLDPDIDPDATGPVSI